MNLPDFFELPIFNELKKKMGIDKSEVAILEPADTSIVVVLPPEGGEVSLKEIVRNSKDGTLDFNGERVIAYIRDFGSYEPRYHIADCKKLQQMRNEGRFDKYFAWKYTDEADQKQKDGYFTVNRILPNRGVISEIKRLNVCRFCLEHLSFDEFSVGWIEERKKNLVASFTPKRFFDVYGTNSNIIKRPKYSADSGPINNYPDNFSEISKKIRERFGWKCQCCGKDLSAPHNRKFLHVHHIDMIKHHNHPSNLEVLCIVCHAEKPGHAQLRSKDDYKACKNIS